MANYKKKSGVMLADKMRKAVLQSAIMGKLTEQRAEDGSAVDLLGEIRAEKERLIAEKVIKKDKPLPPIADDEKPFDIPDSWVWVRLGNLAQFVNGDRSSNYPIESDFVSDGIPFFGAKDMLNQKLSFTENLRFISKEKFDSLSQGKLNHYDFVCLLRGSIGKTALFESFKAYTTGFINAQMVIIRLIDKKDTAVKFLNLIFNSDYFSRFITRVSSGTAVKQLSAETLRNFIIPLPPLAEQQRIVKKLEQIFPELDRLQADEQQIHALQSAFPAKMQASLLQSAISGKLTTQNPETDGNASDLFTQIQAEKQRLIAEKVIKKEKPLPPISDDEKPFDIPDNWMWVRLGDIVSYKIGKTPPRNNIEYWQNDYHWISIADMVESGTILTTKEKVSHTAYDDIFKKQISKAGTMIMSFKLTIGRVSILGMDAFHNEAIISVYPSITSEKLDILKYYLFKILPYVSTWGDSKKAIKGNTLNSDSISNMLIPLPPLAEQQRIIEKLDQLLPQVQSLNV